MQLIIYFLYKNTFKELIDLLLQIECAKNKMTLSTETYFKFIAENTMEEKVHKIHSLILWGYRRNTKEFYVSFTIQFDVIPPTRNKITG